MLDFLKSIAKEDSDVIWFMPGEKENQLSITSSTLKDAGEKLDGSEMGDCYHIVIFNLDEEGDPKNLDKFEAILTRPLEYISGLIPENWYGVVCKKTTTSGEYMQGFFDELKELCYNTSK
jgi:hypothetical protein